MSKEQKVCQTHDPDDVVPDRICGGPLPCPEHSPRAYHQTRRRKHVVLTLSDAARERLRELASRHEAPASRVVEDLVLNAPLPRRR